MNHTIAPGRANVLASNYYLHSSKMNFYNAAASIGLGRINFNNENDRIKNIKNNLKTLISQAETTEASFYKDLNFNGGYKEARAWFKYLLNPNYEASDNNNNNEEISDQKLLKEIGRYLNTKEVTNIINGDSLIIDKEKWKNFEGKSYYDKISKILGEDYALKNVKNYLNNERKKGEKKLDEDFILFFQDVRSNNRTIWGNSPTSIRKRMEEIINSGLLEESVKEKKKKEKNLNNYIGEKVDLVFEKYKINDNERKKEIKDSFSKSIKDYIEKFDNNFYIDERKKANGNTLEISLVIQLKNEKRGKIEKIIPSATSKEKRANYNSEEAKKYFTTGDARTDLVVITTNGNRYGIQAKNTESLFGSTIHFQSKINLDNFLSRMKMGKIMTDEDIEELGYLLVNIFYFQKVVSYKGDNIQISKRTSAVPNVVDYATLLMQLTLPYALQDQSNATKQLQEDVQIIEGELKGKFVGNAFIVYKDELIPVSIIYRAVLNFVEQFNGNQKDNSIGIKRSAAAKVSGVKELNGMYDKKIKALGGISGREEEEWKYPSNLVKVGSDYGKNLISNIEISGVNIYANYSKLEEFIDDALLEKLKI